ncbi:MAG: hypothetical protein WA019_00690 [Candidatus Moraniibacteriota bacterium]
MIEELKKRQAELEKEFNDCDKLRQQLRGQMTETETHMVELTGAYNEVGRQIKELEKPEVKNENKRGNKK